VRLVYWKLLASFATVWAYVYVHHGALAAFAACAALYILQPFVPSEALVYDAFSRLGNGRGR